MCGCMLGLDNGRGDKEDIKVLSVLLCLFKYFVYYFKTRTKSLLSLCISICMHIDCKYVRLSYILTWNAKFDFLIMHYKCSDCIYSSVYLKCCYKAQTMAFKLVLWLLHLAESWHSLKVAHSV